MGMEFFFEGVKTLSKKEVGLSYLIAVYSISLIWQQFDWLIRDNSSSSTM